jgi:hypothetical protein
MRSFQEPRPAVGALSPRPCGGDATSLLRAGRGDAEDRPVAPQRVKRDGKSAPPHPERGPTSPSRHLLLAEPDSPGVVAQGEEGSTFPVPSRPPGECQQSSLAEETARRRVRREPGAREGRCGGTRVPKRILPGIKPAETSRETPTPDDRMRGRPHADPSIDGGAGGSVAAIRRGREASDEVAARPRVLEPKVVPRSDLPRSPGLRGCADGPDRSAGT